MKRVARVSSVSLFLPCYNEQDSIEAIVRDALRVLPGQAHEFEVLIVNDGSTDGSREKALALTRDSTLVRLIDIPHGGYGAALSAGFAAARHDWVAYTDADGQFTVEDFPRLLDRTDDHPCIIGYREQRAEGGVRRLNQFLLKVWALGLFGIPWRIRDINCGFKLIRRDLLDRCLPLTARGGIVSTELLRALVRQGVSIAQVPVRHFPRQHGQATGAQPRVILKAIKETLRLVTAGFPGRQA